MRSPISYLQSRRQRRLEVAEINQVFRDVMLEQLREDPSAMSHGGCGPGTGKVLAGLLERRPAVAGTLHGKRMTTVMFHNDTTIRLSGPSDMEPLYHGRWKLHDIVWHGYGDGTGACSLRFRRGRREHEITADRVYA